MGAYRGVIHSVFSLHVNLSATFRNAREAYRFYYTCIMTTGVQKAVRVKGFSPRDDSVEIVLEFRGLFSSQELTHHSNRTSGLPSKEESENMNWRYP